MSRDIHPDIIHQARAIVELVSWWSAETPPKGTETLPRGPALVYMGWNGKDCGTAHDFKALETAAKTLGLPLYVVNASFGEMLDPTRPGTRIEMHGTALLDKYHFFLNDPRVRLIDKNGDPVGPETLSSTDGSTAIVNAFRPLIDRMRAQQSGIDGGHGRA